MRIFVIEDNQENIELVEYLLAAHGYSPVLAMSGEEGLLRTAELKPDVILLDIWLPGIDGYELAAAIKMLPGLENTSARSGHGLGDDRRPGADRRSGVRWLHPEADRPRDVHRRDRTPSLPADDRATGTSPAMRSISR